MRRMGSGLVFVAAVIAVGCSSSSSSSSSGGGGSCDTKTLTCGQAATTADLTDVFGAAPTTYDESGHPNCNIKLASGGGGIQVFCGDTYASMLGGAKSSYSSGVTETNDVGAGKTFEVQSTDVVEVGFLASGGKYSVLVNLITGAADITKARALAKKVDANLASH